MMYEYRVLRIIKVVDGDTIDCEITAGFGINLAFRFRVAGVDTPEQFGAHASLAGVQAHEFTDRWIAARTGHLLVRTLKSSSTTVGIGDGAFGRWLAEFVDDRDASTLSDALVVAGFDTGRR